MDILSEFDEYANGIYAGQYRSEMRVKLYNGATRFTAYAVTCPRIVVAIITC